MNGLFLNIADMRLRRMRQRVRAFIDLCGDKSQDGDRPGRWAMLTLTYAEVMGWSAGDIRAYLIQLKQWAMRHGFVLVYVWVAELQRRGAVHYHVLVKLPKGYTVPKPDKSFWHHGHSEVAWVRLSGKRYMAKYTSKGSDGRGDMPDGLRMCGAGGLTAVARRWWTWLLSPKYVRQETDPADMVQRVKGGWRCRGAGAAYRFIPTPWVATPFWELGGVWLSRKSADRWVESTLDPDPVETWQGRQNFIDCVRRFWANREERNGVRYVEPWLPYDGQAFSVN
jgi:hypothetical protein